MLHIFADHPSPRLQFVCDFIFTDYFGLSYNLVTEPVGENLLVYTSTYKVQTGFRIPVHGLLEQTTIHPQNIQVVQQHNVPVFFAINGRDMGFDIFSACFYLLSRYEEYLPNEPDMYGRYPHTDSLAFKNKFLNIPLISYWLTQFKESLLKHFPGLRFRDRSYSFTPSYDIDIAYSYKGKGIVRNLGGFLQSPSLGRIKVNLGLQKDPYDAYEFLNDLHTRYGLKPVYFFLLAEKLGKYDKNLSPHTSNMKELLQAHTEKYEVGIHPSWDSYHNAETIQEEKNILQQYTSVPVTKSRQHYIRMTLPESYSVLLQAGITEDYSMGYGSTNGFRASVAEPFFWYDLKAEKVTKLRIHPFCFMDANCFFEQKQGSDAAYQELLHYYNECVKTQSPLISIFHNDFLGTEKMFEGFREMYTQFIQEHAVPANQKN